MAPDLTPVPSDIELHLREITRRWAELGEPALLELVFLSADDKAIVKDVRHFAPDEVAEAARHVAAMNVHHLNAYAVVNPVNATNRPATGKRASAEHILGSFFHWADGDSPEAAQNIRNFVGARCTMHVLTGATPHDRPHVYWELEEPTRNLAAWEATQRAIAATLKTDPSVVDPPRIMRIAGTINWPKPKKQAKGYIAEITRLRVYDRDARPPISAERMARAFAVKPSEKPFIDTGTDFGPTLDRALAAANILGGNDWRDNVKRLVCSYVARGWTDDEIIARCAAFTLAGYTVDDTRADVAAFITWARQQEATNGGKYASSPERATPPTGAAAASVPQAAPFRSWASVDPATIPPRDFIYGDHYIRRFASVTVAPGGLGKSTLVLAECVAMATGRPILEVAPKARARVVYFNAEDPDDEIKRRVVALCEHHRIPQEELVGQLFIASGRTTELLLAAGESGDIVEPVFELMERFAAEHAIDVFAFDPLANMTESPETNDVFRRLGKRLSRFADATNSSVELVHHTRKLNGKEAEIEDSRGGGALIGAVRAGRVLNPMTTEEAAKAGLGTHIDHFRIEAAGKNNLARPSDRAVWLAKVSVELANGDHVASISRWDWPDAFDGVTHGMARLVQKRIGTMDPPPKASPQSKEWGGYVVADVLGMDAEDKRDRARISQMLKTWLKNDVLRVESIHNARAGREVPALVPGSVIPGEGE